MCSLNLNFWFKCHNIGLMSLRDTGKVHAEPKTVFILLLSYFCRWTQITWVKSQSAALNTMKIDAHTTFFMWHFHSLLITASKIAAERWGRCEWVPIKKCVCVFVCLCACMWGRASKREMGREEVFSGGQGHDDDEFNVRLPLNETANVWPLDLP